MSVINTNYLALVSQNNLTKSQNALGQAIERLSSGLRINSAKDDAAGQAIANRFTSNINGLTQASRNANDGISIAQTTEGSLNEINENLQRIRVLTNQAVNGTNSPTDLKSIQDEIDQRLEEIDRVSRETDFNGVKVLAEDQKLKIQVGAHDNQTISVNLQAINTKSLELDTFNVSNAGSVANKTATADDLTLAGFTAGAAVDGSTSYTQTVVTPNAAATSADVIATLAQGETVTYNGVDTGLSVAAATNTYTADGEGNFTFDVAAGSSTAGLQNYLTSVGETVDATINIGGTSVAVKIASGGTVTAQDGSALYLDATGNLTQNTAGAPPVATLNGLIDNYDGTGAVASTITVGDTVISLTGSADAGTTTGTMAVTGAQISAGALSNVGSAAGYTTNTGYTVAAGGAVSDGTDALYVQADGSLGTEENTTVTTTYFAHENGNVTTNTGQTVYVDGEGELTLEDSTATTRTEKPLDAIDSALAKVDALRSELGAVQNRFQSTISNLANTVNNLSAARSRIQDADYAVEVSNMTRAQILQQAGTSVLAQANQIPQGVLSLLR